MIRFSFLEGFSGFVLVLIFKLAFCVLLFYCVNVFLNKYNSKKYFAVFIWDIV